MYTSGQIDVLDKLATSSSKGNLYSFHHRQHHSSPFPAVCYRTASIFEVKLRKLDFGSFHPAEKKRVFSAQNTCFTKEHPIRVEQPTPLVIFEKKERKKAAPTDMIMGMANTISDIFHCCHVGQIIRLQSKERRLAKILYSPKPPDPPPLYCRRDAQRNCASIDCDNLLYLRRCTPGKELLNPFRKINRILKRFVF